MQQLYEENCTNDRKNNAAQLKIIFWTISVVSVVAKIKEVMVNLDRDTGKRSQTLYTRYLVTAMDYRILFSGDELGLKWGIHEDSRLIVASYFHNRDLQKVSLNTPPPPPKKKRLSL